MMQAKPFIYCFRVPFHQVDRAGILFFAHVFTHAHDAYEMFMQEKGLELGGIVEVGERIPLVHAEADYHHPLQHGDEVRVELAVKATGRSSMTLEYRFFNTAETHCVTVNTVHVFVRKTASDNPACGWQ
ncbi:MAG: acyl-CoA thioesterase [Gammaproteobacteria bacterium]|nr:acyl-CoA thioesterase [Gammaproteobacteria bacterium]MBU1723964.1 acyl-CoA thioesterase [Gammaproteobacteria bacterium]MBU2007157.1 acyl-CoA thioesterase [Gammaproteobacteria bacterium]